MFVDSEIVILSCEVTLRISVWALLTKEVLVGAFGTVGMDVAAVIAVV